MNNALVFLFFLISQTTFSQLIKVNDSSHKESSYGPEETYYESCQSIVSQIDTAKEVFGVNALALDENKLSERVKREM